MTTIARLTLAAFLATTAGCPAFQRGGNWLPDASPEVDGPDFPGFDAPAADARRGDAGLDAPDAGPKPPDGGGCGTPGKTCVGMDLVTCGADGVSTSVACPNGCDFPRSVCYSCRPNARNCLGASSAVCRSDGTGIDTVVCPSGCNAITGECNSCEPSTTWCNVAVLRECTAMGQQRDKETCANGCTAGKCNACNPGGPPTCRDTNTAQFCRGDGSGLDSMHCPNGCTAGRCNSCRPATTTCNGSSREVCRMDGTGVDREACPVPDNGRSICLAGECVPACNTGFHMCGSQCRNDSSKDSCGIRCTACPEPPNSTAMCLNARDCAISCHPGFDICSTSSGCQPVQWDFDTGIDGFERASVPISSSTTQSRSGSALAVRIGDYPRLATADFESPWICGRTAKLNLHQRTVSAWFYIDAPGRTICDIRAIAWESSETTAPTSGYERDGWLIVQREFFSNRQWVLVAGAWPPDATGFAKLVFHCSTSAPDIVTGFIYVDQVSVK